MYISARFAHIWLIAFAFPCDKLTASCCSGARNVWLHFLAICSVYYVLAVCACATTRMCALKIRLCCMWHRIQIKNLPSSTLYSSCLLFLLAFGAFSSFPTICPSAAMAALLLLYYCACHFLQMEKLPKAATAS